MMTLFRRLRRRSVRRNRIRAENKPKHLTLIQIDWEVKNATCPEGKLSSSLIPGRDNRGNDANISGERSTFAFLAHTRQQCPAHRKLTNNQDRIPKVGVMKVAEANRARLPQ